MLTRVISSTLIGRDEELSQLEDALLEANRGRSRFVVLSGEAGMGKTRLTNELAKRAAKLGTVVLSGGCSGAELSLPYLPLVEAIGNWLANEDVRDIRERLGPAARELGQLFPQLSAGSRVAEGGDMAQAKLRLFEAFVSLLSIAAAERPLLLVVEDVHWADFSTREVLDYLARRAASVRVLLLLTYRTDELHRKHPLLPTIQAWKRSNLGDTVELEPLSADDVAKMISVIFDGEKMSAAFRDLMHERCEGNPFVLEEMLREAVDRGDIYKTPTGWDRKSLAELRIPDTVMDTILLRFNRLDGSEIDVLQTAAVLGRSFDHSILTEVAGTDESTVRSALQAAVNLQLLEEEPHVYGHFRWRHALTQEAIYLDMVLPTRQRIHSQAADLLMSRVATNPVDLAVHILGAGRFDEAVAVCIAGAEQAERTYAFEDALRLYERVLPYISDELERGRLLARIGHDYWIVGSPSKAIDVLREATDTIERLGEMVESARARVTLGRSYWESGDTDQAMAHFELAQKVLESAGPSPALSLLYNRIAGIYLFKLEYEEAMSYAERAVEIAEKAGADYERLWALIFVGTTKQALGDMKGGFEILDFVFRECLERGFYYVAQNALYNDLWFRLFYMLGDTKLGLERLKLLPQVAGYSGTLFYFSALDELMRGNLEVALTQAEECVTEYRRIKYPKFTWRANAVLAEVLLELGDLDQMAEVLPDLSTRVDPQDIIYDSSLQIRSRLARGLIEEADEMSETILEVKERLRNVRRTLALGVEGFIASGRLAEAGELVEIAESTSTESGRAFSWQASARLQLAKGSPQDAIPALEKAIAEFARYDYLMDEMRSRLLLAEAYAADGQIERARSHLQQVVTVSAERNAKLIYDSAIQLAQRLDMDVEAELSPRLPQEPAEIPVGERMITSMFADVRGYTPMTSQKAPEEMADKMATLYRWAKREVERHHGIVDKFAGDAVMATFNVGGDTIDHVLKALQAAIALRDKAALMDVHIGVGIAVGPAMLGHTPGTDQLSVTGVATNLAARLQAQAKAGEILLSDEAFRRVEPWFAEQGIQPCKEELALKGFDEPQRVSRIST